MKTIQTYVRPAIRRTPERQASIAASVRPTKRSSVASRRVERDHLEALRARDPDALDRLVREHHEPLLRYLSYVVRDVEEARSLTQETLFQAIRNIETFRGQAKVSTWLYGIANNLANSHLRRSLRIRQLQRQEVDWLLEQTAESSAEAAAWNPEGMVVRREQVRLVHDAIGRLPEVYREVLTKRDLEELSTAETAAALSISNVNVRVRLHRARTALRELLAPYFAHRPLPALGTIPLDGRPRPAAPAWQ